jgi:hypothetical protein
VVELDVFFSLSVIPGRFRCFQCFACQWSTRPGH